MNKQNSAHRMQLLDEKKGILDSIMANYNFSVAASKKFRDIMNYILFINREVYPIE
jgi:hypothetical protein